MASSPASLVFNESLYLGSIAIHKKLNKEGYRLTFPTKVVGGKNLNLYHPINPKASKAIEAAIFQQFNNVMNKSHDRYSRS